MPLDYTQQSVVQSLLKVKNAKVQKHGDDYFLFPSNITKETKKLLLDRTDYFKESEIGPQFVGDKNPTIGTLQFNSREQAEKFIRDFDLPPCAAVKPAEDKGISGDTIVDFQR